MAVGQSEMANPEIRYRYNGKELHSELDLGWYDYGFRWYDLAFARFISVDPISEDFPYLTTYQYANNDPIRNIDLDGLEGIPFDFDPDDFAGESSDLPQIFTIEAGISTKIGYGAKIDVGFIRAEAEVNLSKISLKSPIDQQGVQDGELTGDLGNVLISLGSSEFESDIKLEGSIIKSSVDLDGNLEHKIGTGSASFANRLTNTTITVSGTASPFETSKKVSIGNTIKGSVSDSEIGVGMRVKEFTLDIKAN